MQRMMAVRFGTTVMFVAVAAIGYVVTNGELSVLRSVDARVPTNSQSGKLDLPQRTHQQVDELQRKPDSSATPEANWDNPYIIRLERKDPMLNQWNARDPKWDPVRPVRLPRYASDPAFEVYPTFLAGPVAINSAGLPAADIDRSPEDTSALPESPGAANFLRGYMASSAAYHSVVGQLMLHFLDSQGTVRGEVRDEGCDHPEPVSDGC